MCAYTYTCTYLKSAYVFAEKVIGGTATPIHYVFILAATAKLPVPVSDPEVGLDKCVTHWTIAKDRVEEGLREGERGKRRGGGKSRKTERRCIEEEKLSLEHGSSSN